MVRFRALFREHEQLQFFYVILNGLFDIYFIYMFSGTPRQMQTLKPVVKLYILSCL